MPCESNEVSAVCRSRSSPELCASAGLIVGSYIVQNLGWQWAFHTAFVLSVVLFAAVTRVVKRDALGEKARVRGWFKVQGFVLLVFDVSLPSGGSVKSGESKSGLIKPS